LILWFCSWATSYLPHLRRSTLMDGPSVTILLPWRCSRCVRHLGKMQHWRWPQDGTSPPLILSAFCCLFPTKYILLKWIWRFWFAAFVWSTYLASYISYNFSVISYGPQPLSQASTMTLVLILPLVVHIVATKSSCMDISSLHWHIGD
jgi:hypothetical protein